MAPIIHCVRHAQAYHNLTIANHGMLDPPLTTLGVQQCIRLRNNFPHHNSAELIVSSPLRRTIYTSILAFQPIIARGSWIIALPELQETADLPCDTGSDVIVIEQEYAGKPVDISAVPDDWNSKQGRWAPIAAALEKRAKEVREWLRKRPEKEIVVVTHGGFLHYLTGDWTDCAKFLGTGWENTEFRSYELVEEGHDEGPFIETPASRKRRKSTVKPLTAAEQTELRETVVKSWENEGYQVSEKT